ncbi:MAG TPA: hypothetical protein VKS79_02620 [Gemmataceae bacterium]|nr:hypothetical protein [Gemmataceae bacterium]
MNRFLWTERRILERVRLWSLVIGIVCMAACVIGAFFDPQQFFRAYLAPYLFYQGIGLGCFVLLMIFHVTGGAWGFLIRRFLEAGTRTLPLLALLLIPVGCGLHYTFLWARPEVVAADPNLQGKHLYLNVPFWWARAVLFFVIWLIFAYFLNLWSRREDETGDPRYARRLEILSGPGLVAYGICMHFAAIDWIMSLQPDYKSSIFGPLVASGQVLSGLTWALIVFAIFAVRPPLSEAVSDKTLCDLGNLFLSFIVVWAYMVFFEFMLVWIANLRPEVGWYLDRSRGGWWWVNWLLVLFHFAVPFLLLLHRAVKQNLAWLAVLAGSVLGTHLMFLYWQVLPAFPTASLAHHWMDFLMPVALGGIWFAWFLWQLVQRPILPLHDKNAAHAMLLRHEDLEQAEREAVMSHGGRI